MEQQKFRVLSIDAWADCCGCECEEDKPSCWTWNNWLPLEDFEGVLTEETALDYLLQTYIKKEYWNEFEVEDDQYNLVLIEKESRKPLFAIEYGGKI